MANTQTAVPLFVANAILTAAQQNISAGTGVPVFATTVTRDAAFGGSNKALAEGQLCYLEDSNSVQYYTGAAWATVGPTASKIAQVLSVSYSTETSTTSTSYVTSGVNLSITPTLNTSKVLIICNAQFANTTLHATIFRGTVAGTNLALSATKGFVYQDTTASQNASLTFLDSPATTSATTYTIGFRSVSGTSFAQANDVTSTMTLIEVLA